MRYLSHVIKNLWQWVLVTSTLLSPEVLALLSRSQRLYIGFSGGLDSTVLLHCLAQFADLKQKLVAVHINHGLSDNALSWQRHCEKLAFDLAVSFVVKEARFSKLNNIEDNARQARYAIFASLVGPDDALLVAHHADDQVETFLLQLFRGAGVAGLSAMPLIKPFAQGLLIRPLLSLSRADLEAYATQQQLESIFDESNLNTHFSRNYLRHEILPLITKRWPGVYASIGRSAQNCQEAQALLNQVARDKARGAFASPCLDMTILEGLSTLHCRNILREWLRAQNVKMPSSLVFERFISELILARDDASPLVEWGKWAMRRFNHRLYLTERFPLVSHLAQIWQDFPKPLYIEGLGTLYAIESTEGIYVPKLSKVKVRFREGGEHIRLHGLRKSIKKLFQVWQIPPWQRQSVPLIDVNAMLLCVVGYAYADPVLDINHKTNLYQIELHCESKS